MKFINIKKFWITDFGWPDVSFGIHICMDKRIDIHFLKWMISLGNVPIYQDKKGYIFAVANSYHNGKSKNLRSGTP